MRNRVLFILTGLVVCAFTACTKVSKQDIASGPIYAEQYAAISKSFCAYLDALSIEGTDNQFQLSLTKTKAIMPDTPSLSPEFIANEFTKRQWDISNIPNEEIEQIKQMMYEGGIMKSENMEMAFDYICNLPEEKIGPCMLFYQAMREIYVWRCTNLTKTNSPWVQFWLDISTSTIGAIYGSAIGAILADATVGAAVGGAVGVIIGAALGLVLYYSQGDVIISGIVVDEVGEPLVGANIMATGTTIGVVTSAEGTFTLRVPAGSVLVISYIGYETQVVDTNNQGVFEIHMSPDE